MLRKFIASKTGGGNEEKPPTPPSCDDDVSTVGGDNMEEATDNVASSMLAYCRRKFMERGLVGSVELSRLSGVIVSTVAVEVSQEEAEEFLAVRRDRARARAGAGAGGTGAAAEEEGIYDDEDVLDEDLKYFDKKAMSAVSPLLDSLVSRSKAWLACDFAHNIVLSRGTTFGFYLPLFFNVGFSIDITFTASVTSLLAERARVKARKAFKKALKSIDAEVVREIMAQGFTERAAQLAVIKASEDAQGSGRCATFEDTLRIAMSTAESVKRSRDSRDK